MNLNKVDKGFYAIFFILILIIILILISYPKNCHGDLDCFNKASTECSKAKLDHHINNDLYTYTIKGERDGLCMASVYFVKAAQEKDPALKELLEGKGMFCEVPMENIKGPYYEVKDLNDYCSGPLKEAFMHVTIEKLYGIVVQNIGQISQEMRRSIEST